MTPEALRDLIVAALDDMKGRNVVALNVAGQTSVTDCMIIASGTSRRHVQSLVDNVHAAAKARGVRPLGAEGREVADWVLLDFGDVVLHVMQPQTRAFYDLERLWSDFSAAEAEQPAQP